MINNLDKNKFLGRTSGGGGGNDPMCSNDAIVGEKRLHGGDMGGGGLYVLADEIYKARDYLKLKKEQFQSKDIYMEIVIFVNDAIKGIFSAAYFFILLYLGLIFGYQKISWGLSGTILSVIVGIYLLLRFTAQARANFRGLVCENLIIILGYIWGLHFFKYTNLLIDIVCG